VPIVGEKVRHLILTAQASAWWRWTIPLLCGFEKIESVCFDLRLDMICGVACWDNTYTEAWRQDRTFDDV